MDEIIRRGVAALPDLCAHLSDSRPTKTSIMITQYSADYDWNSLAGTTRPSGVTSILSMGQSTPPKINTPPPGNYTLTVGDLCFELIGRIVNRKFVAVRYQPSMNIIVSSPVLCPDLAKAVRNEWANLTPAQHRALLVLDVERPDGYVRDSRGVRVLEALPRCRSGRCPPPISLSNLRQHPRRFVCHAYAADRSRSAKPTEIDRSIRRNPRPRLPRRDYQLPLGWSYGPSLERLSGEAGKVLSQLQKSIDPDYPPPIPAADSLNQLEFIATLQSISTPQIDQPLQDYLRDHPLTDADKSTLDFLKKSQQLIGPL